MSLPAKILTGVVFFLILIGFGIADDLLTGKDILFPPSSTPQVVSPEPPLLGNQSSSTLEEGSGSAVVTKQKGPDVLALLAAQGVTVTKNSEKSLLRRVLPENVLVETETMLKDSDRLAFLSWTETPDAKLTFAALKQALLKSFSNQVRDLEDRNDIREGKPPRAVLTFLDPTISAERMIFVRCRERLYEFHVPEGKFNQVMGIVDALTDN